MTERPHQLTEICVGDEPAAWARAGFVVRDEVVVIDRTAVHLAGAANGRGIRSVAIVGVDEQIDGLHLHQAATPTAAPEHPNGVTVIDHLVVMTPDCDRTTAALEAAGLEARRVRTFAVGSTMRRQTFFWLGRVILELVGPDEAEGTDPAELWGLALTADDIEQTASALGDACTPLKQAVQAGRRITTIKTRDLDISTALAVMSPHPKR